MSFASPLDVADYFPQTKEYTTGTKPTLATITAWLAQDTALLTSELSVIVDFTNKTPDGDKILKQITAKMTACKVDGALPNIQNVSVSEEKAKRDLCKEAEMLVTQILEGKLIISEPCQDAFTAEIRSGVPYPANKYDKDFRY